jgi:hypothetical protein
LRFNAPARTAMKKKVRFNALTRTDRKKKVRFNAPARTARKKKVRFNALTRTDRIKNALSDEWRSLWRGSEPWASIPTDREPAARFEDGP